MTIHTIYLLVASIVQVAWLYNIKFLDKDRLKKIRPGNFFTRQGVRAWLPLLLYIIFGVTNVIFMTLAMKEIPASTAYALWTGVVLGVATLIDKFYFGQKISIPQYIFLGILFSGVVGLTYFVNL